MPVCSSACSSTIPAFNVGNCSVSTRPGGIRRFVFAACDVVIPDLNDLNAWQYYLRRCKIRATGEIVGSKTQGSFEKRRTSSCKPETVVGKTNQITFTDYNADNILLSDYDMWDEFQNNSDRYRVGMFGCDGRFYPFQPYAIEMDEIIDDNNNGTSHKSGTLSVNLLPLWKPMFINGLEELTAEFIGQECVTAYDSYGNAITQLVDCPFELNTTYSVVSGTDSLGDPAWIFTLRVDRNGSTDNIQSALASNIDELIYEQTSSGVWNLSSSESEFEVVVPKNRNNAATEYGLIFETSGGGCEESKFLSIVTPAD